MAKEDKPLSGNTKREEPAKPAEDAANDDAATVEFPAKEDPSVEAKPDGFHKKKQD